MKTTICHIPTLFSFFFPFFFLFFFFDKYSFIFWIANRWDSLYSVWAPHIDSSRLLIGVVFLICITSLSKGMTYVWLERQQGLNKEMQEVQLVKRFWISLTSKAFSFHCTSIPLLRLKYSCCTYTWISQDKVQKPSVFLSLEIIKWFQVSPWHSAISRISVASFHVSDPNDKWSCSIKTQGLN